MEFFSTFDVEKLLGIKRTRLQEWIDRGFIKPSQASDGKGTKALFSRSDLYGIRLFVALLDLGFNRGAAAEIIDWVLGRPILKQEKSAKWDSDYLNIFRLAPDKKNKSTTVNKERFLMSYGKAEITNYSAHSKKSDKAPFIHIIITLSFIKKIVDENIG
jgi:DNA-binding transcriptional MerR regulator